MTMHSFINRITEVRALLTYLGFFSYQFVIIPKPREVLESSSINLWSCTLCLTCAVEDLYCHLA